MLTGKTAWVTGATGGVGPSVVRALAQAGAAIVVTAPAEASLEVLAREVQVPPERWLAVPADLTDYGAAAAAVAEATARFGGVDILVAVAGGWRGGKPVAETDLETVKWLLDINFLTAFNACRAVLPGMLERNWGRIVTFGARSAVTGGARSGAYAASKAALVALTQSIAAEIRQTGVTANTLLLSTVDTPANRASMPEADYSKWVAPEQIASVVRFLCEEHAASINGAAIPVYGRA